MLRALKTHAEAPIVVATVSKRLKSTYKNHLF